MKGPDVRNVLVIAYYFPPMGLSGVQRTLKFVKYLPQYGWRPTVLTVEPVGYYAQDDSLLEDIANRDVRIVRTAGAGPGKLLAKREVVRLPSERTRKWLSRISDTFFIPDNKIGWKKKAVAKALEINGETPFDLIFSTAPPFTDFLVGAELKRHMRKPLVLDYRDPWLEYPFRFYPTPIHRRMHRVLERRVLKASSHVITTNRAVKERIIKQYSFLTYHDIDIIPQGYDPEDYSNETVPSTAHSDGKMRITYAGIFWEDRVPDYFLRGLHALLNDYPQFRDKIEALFIGNFRDENLKLVEELGLKNNTVVTGYLPHHECVSRLRSSDVLWVTVGDQLGSPGKTYEYIGAGKPILGLVPDGFLKTTILEAGGTTVAPTDVDAIKRALFEFYQQYETSSLKGPSTAVREKYNRVTLTGELARVFNALFEP